MSRPPRGVKLNAIDRMIAFVSPQAGLARLRSRTAMAVASGYVGARKDRNATALWSALGGVSADADTLPDLDVLRARAHDLVRNDPMAQSAVSTKVAHVIGAGHVVRPELDAKRLGLTEAQALEWEELALDIWTAWAESRDCDVTRTQTFAEMEDLVYRSRLMSGDVFVVRRFKDRKGGMIASALQVVEAGRVSNPNWGIDTAALAGGVELDGDGAPVAYHVASHYAADRHMGAAVQWQRIPAFDATGRRQVLHIHGPRWRPDMTRYAPLLAPVIESLKQRSRYSEAELMAAVVSACFAIGMKSDDGDLSTGLSGQGSSESKAGQINLDAPGQIFDLMPGEEVQNFAPGRPNPQFAPFVDAIAREVGAGTDIPRELLVKEFSSSYSASRAAMEIAWLYFRVDRAQHVSQFCVPAYEDVITEAVARGHLKAPGFFTNPLRRKAWLGAVWMGPARPTIDPVKEAKADEIYLDMGVTSLTRIAAERYGVDYRAVQRRRAQDGSDARAQARPSAKATGGSVVEDAPEDDADPNKKSEEEAGNAG
jgi:lambda family phage portal protein